MWENILSNLQMIFWIFGIFSLVYIANILFSIGQSILKMKENFDKSKFLCGIKKMLIIGIGCSLLGVAFTMLTSFINVAVSMFSIDVPENLLTLCNIGGIIVIYFKSIIKYSSESLETLQDLLNNLKVNDGK